MAEVIWQEQFEAASTALSNRERIICECVSDGVTWREVGQQLGIAEDTARMIYRRALSRIRE
jgi:DNA-binding CsgD family transcriptional regulator